MRAAMAAAEVGDDVYGDDPTVNRLQSRMAERFGFERALFFASGTQSNLAALMAHCGRGDEYLVGQEAHTYKYEQGGAAVLGSIQPQPLDNETDGTIPLDHGRANTAGCLSVECDGVRAREGAHDSFGRRAPLQRDRQAAGA